MNKINIQPLNDRIIVEPLPVESKTSKGIIIPETAKDKSQTGVIIAVGPGKKDMKMTVKKGDKILYGKYSGTEIKINGKEYLIMYENDIYGIIK